MACFLRMYQGKLLYDILWVLEWESILFSVMFYNIMLPQIAHSQFNTVGIKWSLMIDS